VGRVELRRGSDRVGRQRQRAPRVPEQLEHRVGAEPRRAVVRRSRDPRRSGRLPQPVPRPLGLRQH
jgi:hypothetical protein